MRSTMRLYNQAFDLRYEINRLKRNKKGTKHLIARYESTIPANIRRYTDRHVPK
jgi:hypothetical protein